MCEDRLVMKLSYFSENVTELCALAGLECQVVLQKCVGVDTKLLNFIILNLLSFQLKYLIIEHEMLLQNIQHYHPLPRQKTVNIISALSHQEDQHQPGELVQAPAGAQIQSQTSVKKEARGKGEI